MKERKRRNKKSRHHDELIQEDTSQHPDHPQHADQLDEDHMLKLEQEVDEEEQKEHDMLHEMRRNEEIKEYSQQDHHVQEGEIDWRNENTRAAQIIDAMAIWIEEDNQSNKNNLPALKKLQYTPTLLMDLKNLRVQEWFLDMGGWKYLADWLSKLPDGSLPCINIIEAGLEIADFLPIEKRAFNRIKARKSSREN